MSSSTLHSHQFINYTCQSILEDQFKVLLEQESSKSYRCADYLPIIRALSKRESVIEDNRHQIGTTNANERASPTSVTEKAHAHAVDMNTQKMITPNTHLTSGPSKVSTTATFHINESWREKISEWFYKVVDHFNFDREIVAITLDYLDRHLSNYAVAHANSSLNESGTDQATLSARNDAHQHDSSHACASNREQFLRMVSPDGYRLAAMGALTLALKLYQPFAKNATDLFDIVLAMGNGQRHVHSHCSTTTNSKCDERECERHNSCVFTLEGLKEMELCILTNLSWRVSPPTPCTFLNLFFEILQRGHVPVPEPVLLHGSPPQGTTLDGYVQHVHAEPYQASSKLARIMETAKFSIELSLCDYFFVHRKPSSVALASILNALFDHGRNDTNIQSQSAFLTHVHAISGKSYCKEVHLCRERLHTLQACNR